jgi:hypothetical protein
MTGTMTMSIPLTNELSGESQQESNTGLVKTEDNERQKPFHRI